MDTVEQARRAGRLRWQNMERTPVFGREFRWEGGMCLSCRKKKPLVVVGLLATHKCGTCYMEERHG